MPRFDMQEFLALVQKYRVTVLPLVPPIVLGLVKHPAVAQSDLSSVRLVFSGAAPLGEDIGARAQPQARLPGGPGLRHDRGEPGDPPEPDARRADEAGLGGLRRAEHRGEDRRRGDRRAIGAAGARKASSWIRGPQIMKGYLNQPEETAACLDRDGWYHTGDVGYVDDDGYFFIVDRTKELIKYKGLQVAPAELEALLLTHPAVLDAAVVRSADEEAGEVPKAFVVLKADEASRATHGRRHHGLGRRAGRPAQAYPPHRVHRPDPEVGLGQDPPPRADRPREVRLAAPP